MRDARAAAIAAGEGALFGTLAGVGRGALEAFVHRDLTHGMPWTAADRIVGPAALWGAAGVIAALALGAVLAAAGPAGTRRARMAAGSCAALAVAAAALCAGPWRAAIVPEASSAGLPAALLSFGTQIGAALAIVAARFRDAWRMRLAGGPRAWAAGAGLGGLALAGVGAAAFPALAASRAADRPNVILVSLDTLRADRLQVYGGPADLMPRLGALASAGAVFDRAQAASPWTLPSHASLFTARLPFDHGARWSYSRIHPRRALLAERLREAGYRTVAFNGDGYVAASFGFAQGFDLYAERHEEERGGADGVVDDAISWMGANGGRPFFLFLHTYEPHVPYVGTGRADPADRGRLPATFTSETLARVQRGDLVLDEHERRYVRSLYDGDAEITDRALGRFLDAAAASGILDRSIVVVLSDHGEALWDREGDRSPGHGHSLGRELLHVPLIFRAPGRISPGRLRTPVSLIDVAPTLLDLLGLPADPDHRGRSLAQALRTGEEPEPTPLFAESVEYGPDRFAAFADGYKAVVVPEPSVVFGGVRLKTSPLEVFDLEADPDERIDLGADPPRGSARAVRLAFERAREKLGKGLPEASAQDVEEVERALRSLGYVR